MKAADLGRASARPARGDASLYFWCCQACLLCHQGSAEMEELDGTERQILCSCGGELCGCAPCENVALAAASGVTFEDRVRLVLAAGLGDELQEEVIS